MDKVSKKKRYVYLVLGIVFLLSVLTILIIRSFSKLTYKEYITYSDALNSHIRVDSVGTNIEQDFRMPYELLNGVAIQAGTYNRDNNSEWMIQVIRKADNRLIAEKRINASILIDNAQTYIAFSKNHHVKKGDIYTLRISPVRVSSQSSIAFWCDDFNSELDNVRCNGIEERRCLSFSVYGGDVDYWWTGFYSIIWLLVVLVFARGVYLNKKKISLLEDRVLCGLAIGLFSFVLTASFSTVNAFIDETDNMLGGLTIARGKVLYRDYVTQHTPFAYYLCALFAKMGAKSVQQFRLSYDIFVAAIWMFVVMRYKKNLGNKILLLPILESILLISLVGEQGSLCLSDGIEGLCITVLMLEFYCYYNDRELDWKRSIVIACCIFGCIGTAFISLYPLSIIFFAVLGIEVKYWIDHERSFGLVVRRYYRMVIFTIIPFAFSILYFRLTGSMGQAWEQMYRFNREIYPTYLGGLGTSVIEPYIEGVKNVFGALTEPLNHMLTLSIRDLELARFIVMACMYATLVKMILKRRIIEGIVTIGVIACCLIRVDYNTAFHQIPAWSIAILFVLIFADLSSYTKKAGFWIVATLGFIVVSNTYFSLVAENFKREESAIYKLDERVVAFTEENEGIYMDAGMSQFNPIYLNYKKRYAINRAVYMLPWYMDWYEQDEIDDLITHNPRIVLYDEERAVYGFAEYAYTNYANDFFTALKDNYFYAYPELNAGWKKKIWAQK